jgi:hypothetical protein
MHSVPCRQVPDFRRTRFGTDDVAREGAFIVSLILCTVVTPAFVTKNPVHTFKLV